jgi:hypothetical protein
LPRLKIGFRRPRVGGGHNWQLQQTKGLQWSALRPVHPGGSRESNASYGQFVCVVGDAWPSQTETRQRRRERRDSCRYLPGGYWNRLGVFGSMPPACLVSYSCRGFLKSRIQVALLFPQRRTSSVAGWIPACAGMTKMGGNLQKGWKRAGRADVRGYDREPDF